MLDHLLEISNVSLDRKHGQSILFSALLSVRFVLSRFPYAFPAIYLCLYALWQSENKGAFWVV
jgi:hypothetical protein